MAHDDGSRKLSGFDRNTLLVSATSMVAIFAVAGLSAHAINSIRQVGTILAEHSTGQLPAVVADASYMPVASANAPQHLNPHVLGVSAPAPVVAAPAPVVSAPTPVVAAPQQFDPSLLLDQPEVVTQVLETVSLAAGIDAPGEISGEYPVYAIFDPRCPYCHAAFAAMNGKVSIRWIPTLALGVTPQGEATIAGILGPTEAAMSGGQIASVTLVEDPERVNRLAAAMAGDRVPSGEISDAVSFILNENLSMAAQLAPLAGPNVPFGVPTFIVPRPDGTAAFVRGWDDATTLSEITEAYTRGS